VDTIPHPDDDPIMRLMVHYFEPAELMHKQFAALEREWDHKGKLSRNKTRHYTIYLQLWLATLFVLAEGFRDQRIKKRFEPWRKGFPTISMHCSSIYHKMRQLGDELKTFRNATFHFHPTAEKHFRFLRAPGRHKPLHWAQELQKEFAMLFSEYRVERTALYWDQEFKKGPNFRITM
jgi:hypothetical protein